MDESYAFRFPFDKCGEDGATIVIYGAGQVGREYVSQIRDRQSASINILYIADRTYEAFPCLDGIEVCSPERLRAADEYDFVVIASWWFADEMLVTLRRLRVPSTKIIITFPLGNKPFASHGEDVAIYMFFKFLGKTKFSYIDIGANDPYNGSNTAYLYAHGCHGICVEANPDLIEDLKQARPEDIVINVGVAAKAGLLPYYMFRTHTFNTFSEKLAEVAKRRSPLQEVRHIPVVTLTEIIEKYSDGVYPDFLQIDIEGFDYEVLDSCDFTNNSPIAICTEINGFHMRRTIEMLDIKGYFPFHRTISNMIYIRKDVKEMYPLMSALASN